MASVLSTLSTPLATLSFNSGVRTTTTPQMKNLSTSTGPVKKGNENIIFSLWSGGIVDTKISCSIAQPETLQIVQSTIAKQLSIDETAVTRQTKFADLGADSLDTVEIMMTLEEKFDISIGEGGAESISTVQDAADLLEKVKKTAST